MLSWKHCGSDLGTRCNELRHFKGPIESFCFGPLEIKFPSSSLNCESSTRGTSLQLGRRNWYYLVFTTSLGKCFRFVAIGKAPSAAGSLLLHVAGC